mmetsp:Transcript_122593/g.318742  ORF Transcript_122593/g.318742 Transcript_122593/m.318742 type:complete len:228 (+) Transcript_122593:64-747(+)
MADPPPNGGEGQSGGGGGGARPAEAGAGTGAASGGSSPREVAHSRLLEFAASAKAGALPSSPDGSQQQLAEELEGIIREVARTGATNGYPWDALRRLLARKVELVLGEFWRDTPDVQVQEGDSFERSAVEPLTRSLLEPRREGAPFTVQRLCELLAEPRGVYKSTRKYLYALQRAVVVTSTEEALSAQAKIEPLLDTSVAASAGGAGAPAGRKRKLPPELSNGVVAE